MAVVHAATHGGRPSPTLDNPDMILPYSGTASSPIPLASSPTLHKAEFALSPRSNISVSPSSRDSDPQAEVGVATAIRMPIRVRPAPPANILATSLGYEHGAPLSDIGEEEMTPRSKRSRVSRTPSPAEPLSPAAAARSLRHKKHLSIQSTSSNGSDIGNWEDFDTSKMMNPRLAADVAKADEDTDIDGLDSKRNSIVAANAEDEMAILNERAERILANARKRLTHMEDNLSKARHSVLLTQKSSPNLNELHQPAGGLYRSISLASTGSHRKSRPLYPIVKAAPPVHARGSSDTTPNSGLRRLSMIPEVRSSSAQEYGRRAESPQYTRGSPITRYVANSPASSRSVNSPMRPLEEEEEEEDGSPSTTKTSPGHDLPRGLGINTMSARSKENVSVAPSPSPTALVRSTSAASSRSTRELREQMSDLRNRITDLKSKSQADSAKRRNVQSRNTPSPFASAQTPEQWYTSAPEYKEGGSPLNTNAGLGWSPGHRTVRSLDTQQAPVTPKMRSFLDIEPPSTVESFGHSDVRTDVNTPSLHKRTVDVVPEPVDEGSVIQESNYEEAAQGFDDDEDQVAASEEEQIYLNEVLEESLHDVEPEVPEIPEHLLAGDGEAERHEDRLDAFDYENMFLHSAMGNYTGGRSRSRSVSDGSDSSSVATRRANQKTPTAGDEDDGDGDIEHEDDDDEDSQNTDEEAEKMMQHPALEHDSMPTPKGLQAPPKPWLHGRSTSMDSISTAATFATATEGEQANNEEDETPHEILHWGNGTAFPQPPSTSPKKEVAAAAWPTPPTSARALPGPSPRLRNPVNVHHKSLSIVTGNSFANGGMPTPPAMSPARSTPSPVVAHASRNNPQNHPQHQHSDSTGTQSYSPQLPQQPRQTQSPYPDSVISSKSHGTATSDHPANTEILMESLIKLADPDFRVNGAGAGNTFADLDKELVLQLLRSVGAVCDGILKADARGDIKWTRLLRRRLDAARAVLDGETEGSE